MSGYSTYISGRLQEAAAGVATLGLTPIGASTAHAGIPSSGSAEPQQQAASPLETIEFLLAPIAEAKKLTASDSTAGDEFGYAAAISGDTIVVGAWNNDGAGSDAGAAYVFERNQGGKEIGDPNAWQLNSQGIIGDPP